MQILTDHWEIIAQEAATLRDAPIIDAGAAKNRADLAEFAKSHWIQGWDGYTNWLAWGIFFNRQFIEGWAHLPQTKKLLQQVHGLRFASFLILKPGVLLKKHEHPENSCLLTYHLGLDVPDECYLNADGVFIQEENGKGFTFDGSKPHYAFNVSDKDRLILHCEIAR